MLSILPKIKISIYSINGMNKESYFTTPVGYIKYDNDTIELKETGINPFAKPFEFMKYKEKEIELKEDGINPFAKPFIYMKYGEKLYLN